MGRRSRKRTAGAPPRERPPVPAAPAPRRTARDRRDQAPPAPWGSFPLIELATLVAIIAGVIGFVSRNGPALVAAVVLGSLAGLELSIREHFGGYRSHASLLAGVVAVVALAGLSIAGVPRVAVLPVAAALFATAFFPLRATFKRRSGM